MLPGQVPVDPNQQEVEEAEAAVAEVVGGPAKEEEEETLMAVTEAAEVTAVSPIGVVAAQIRCLRL